ncbi:lytic transglycosylase domain-containing protein [Undibacterium sp. Di26W]|uniref:lytic transglycosylase domain-containing protein n=1 Tax=Undibacterium sp. Di26W TaxID=3413035 RepID=UPI003BF370D1
MYTNYRSPFSNNPYADDENGDADQMPDQSQGADPQYDAAGESQQDELTQNKTNSVDELMHYLAMNIPVGEGIISRPSGADLLALANNSDSDYPSSFDSGYDAPDAGPTAEQTPEPPEASEARAISPEIQKEIDQVKGASSASLKDRYAAYLLATRKQDEISHMQSAVIPDDELQTDVSTPEFAAFNRRLDAGNVNVSGLYDKAKKIADRMNAPPDPREFTDARNEAAQRRTPEEAQAFKEELAAATARHFFDLLKPETSKDTDVNDRRADSKDEPDTEELDRRNTQKLHDDISSIVQKIDQLSSDKKEGTDQIAKNGSDKVGKIKIPDVNPKAQKKYQEYRPYFDAAAEAAGVDAASLRAMAKVETGGTPDPANARNSKKPGAATGVLQLTPDTWADTVKRHKELAKYNNFSKYSTDPEANIMVGAFALKDKGDAINVPKKHPDFYALTIAAYNAGQGTINEAIGNAARDNQKDPQAAAMNPKYLGPAIASTHIDRYYLDGHGGEKNPYNPGKPGASEKKAKQWAIDAKVMEISQYVPKMYHYKSSEK